MLIRVVSDLFVQIAFQHREFQLKKADQVTRLLTAKENDCGITALELASQSASAHDVTTPNRKRGVTTDKDSCHGIDTSE